MFYIHEMDGIRQNRPSVITIGKFDGFHRGHQKIIREALARKEGNRQLLVFTFSRSPQLMMAGRTGASLNTKREQLALAERLGVDAVVECPFTDEMRHMSAESFLRDILLEQLSVRAIVAGPDCGFGYQRRGNVEFLRERSAEMGFSLHIVEKEKYLGEPISSTRIREALSRGDVERAEDMLGYAFGYSSEILHGRHLGSRLGFPTLNQEIPAEKLIPALGVYAAEIVLEGRRYQGIANVGVKPTISGCRAAGVETCIFDFDEEVYGKQVRVNLKHFVRPERRFPSLEALKIQVEEDKEKVKNFWKRS